MKAETRLARVFSDLASESDTAASKMLTIVKDAAVRNIEELDALVLAAYEANGWNKSAGRPRADAEPLESVPVTVQTYVSWMRTALREGLHITRYETFHELRSALRKKRDLHDVNARVPRGMKGARAVLQTVRSVFTKLPPGKRSLAGRQLEEALKTWLKAWTPVADIAVEKNANHRKAA